MTGTRTDKPPQQSQYTVSVILTHTELYNEKVNSDKNVRGSTLFGPLALAAGKDERIHLKVKVNQTV